MSLARGTHLVCIDASHQEMFPEDKRLVLYQVYVCESDRGDVLRLMGLDNFGYSKARFYVPDFKDGDEVICVSPNDSLIQGRLYTISGEMVMELESMVNLKERSSRYYAWRFLPVAIYQKTCVQDCPDCKGTGEYIGFLTREVCRRCQGKRTVSS